MLHRLQVADGRVALELTGEIAGRRGRWRGLVDASGLLRDASDRVWLEKRLGDHWITVGREDALADFERVALRARRAWLGRGVAP